MELDPVSGPDFTNFGTTSTFDGNSTIDIPVEVKVGVNHRWWCRNSLGYNIRRRRVDEGHTTRSNNIIPVADDLMELDPVSGPDFTNFGTTSTFDGNSTIALSI
jgi:hypothetical protein